MMITKESDYGIRILRALRDGGLMTIQQVCERECIPKQFAYKILKSWTTPDWSRSNAAPAAAAQEKSGGYHPVRRNPRHRREFFLTHCLQNDFRCEYLALSSGCTIHRELARVQGFWNRS